MKHKRQLVFVCNGSDCKKCGSKPLVKDLKKEFGKGHFKGGFKVIQTKCMDMCKSAPIVIVGDHFFKKAELQRIIGYIEKP